MIEEEVTTSDVVETQDAPEVVAEEKPEKEKTVRDSIKDAIAILKSDETDDNNNGHKGKTTEDKIEAQKRAQKAPRRKTVEFENGQPKESAPQKSHDETPPPAALNLQEKEWYKRQPPETKRVMSRIVNQSIAEMTKAQQAAAHERNQRGEWENAVAPFKKSWAMRGLSDAQAVRQLAAVNQHLIDNGAKGIADLARAMKVDPNEIISHLGGQNGQPQNQGQQQHSLPESLTQELNESRLFRQELIQAAQRQQQAQIYSAGQAIAAEIKSVMDEIDSSGNYKYRELYDDSFRKSLEPLLLALRQKDPSLSWAELTKRAYAAVTGKGFEPTSYAQKVSVNPQRKLQAAVSVKGRGASTARAFPKAQGSETVRDSIRRAIELNRRGENY